MLAVSVERDGMLIPVTRHASGLTFSKQVPGGHWAASVRLDLPPGQRLRFGDRLVVSDAHSGAVKWDGYMEWPTPTDSVEAGGTHEVQAIGGRTLLADETVPIFILDTQDALNPSAWWRRPLSGPGAQAGVSSVPTPDDDAEVDPAVLVQFPQGMETDLHTRSGMEWSRAAEAGASLQYVWGVVTYGGLYVNHQALVMTAGSGGWVANPALTRDFTFDGSSSLLLANVAAGTLPAGVSKLRLLLNKHAGGASGVGNDRLWAAWSQLMLGARLMRIGGALRAWDDYPGVGSVRADMIVEDVIGRHASQYVDATSARVAATSYPIRQFSRPGGTTVAQVLDDLALWEPDHFWEIGERVNGARHRFAYRKWDATARYVLGSRVSWTAGGRDVEMCNRIVVTWTDGGSPRRLEVSRAVPELDDRGRVRHHAPLSLPEGYGSVENATRMGEQLLEAANAPDVARTATVAHPVLDLMSGRMVEPWEIEPGHLVRFQEDGVELRLTAMSFSADSGVATLSCGTPSLTNDQRLAQLAALR